MGKKIFYIIRHLVAVLFFLFFPLTIFREEGLELLKLSFPNPYYWIFCISMGLVFYFYYYYFVPKFFLTKKYSVFGVITFLIFILFFLIKPFDLMVRFYYVQKGIKVPPVKVLEIDLFSIVFFLIFVSLALAIKMLQQWRLTEKRALQAEAEKATAELSFLKAQINPHFLFNTLNNIYSLSIDNHPDASDSIMKLSNLMRYITDEATQDYVPLTDEIASINDYISLQKLRHSAKVHLNFSVTGKIEDKQIAPLILMTYIENVFKYGVSAHEDAPIIISIEADDNEIRFFCQNKIFPTSRVNERTGIGLINTRQRLHHLYPNRHKLTITNENNLYTVALALQI